MLNPLPLTLADLIATLSEPSLVNFNVCDAGLPKFTFPKSTVEGVILKLLVAPVPVSVAVTGVGCRAMVTEILPLCCPEDLGLKAAVSFIVWPGVSIVGPEKPVTLNPDPVAVIFVNVTSAVPRLLTIAVWLALDPIPTLPKLIELGVMTRFPF
jgi:hypothetical protein